MRIDELKKIAEENDYELRSDLWQHSLKRKGCDTYININGKIENRIWVSIVTICDEKDFKMLKAAVEFAETPPEDREEEKKFYLEHRWLDSENEANYLNFEIDEFYYSLDSKPEVSWVKTKFTLKEIEEIKEKFDTDLADFELVEVEE